MRVQIKFRQSIYKVNPSQSKPTTKESLFYQIRINGFLRTCFECKIEHRSTSIFNKLPFQMTLISVVRVTFQQQRREYLR